MATMLSGHLNTLRLTSTLLPWSRMQFMQVADNLAAAGFLVVAPNVFRGKPWSMDKFPPKPEDNFMGWLQGYSWDVSRQLTAAQAPGV